MNTYKDFNELASVNNSAGLEQVGGNLSVWNMGKVYDFKDYEIYVLARNEHLPSHVHIYKDNDDLGKISIYKDVEVIDPQKSKIPKEDRATLIESIKTNRKKCQKEWNKLNGKPIPDLRKDKNEKH